MPQAAKGGRPMNVRSKQLLLALCALIAVFALVGVTACAGESAEDEPAENGTVPARDQSDGDDSADGDGVVTDDSGDDSSAGDVDEAELRDGAQDIAQAWLIGPGSEYTADDLEFNVETLLQSGDGSWWARVSATPNDPSMETEQIYVTLPPGMTIWQPVDSGTGIDPPTDDRFPEDIRSEL